MHNKVSILCSNVPAYWNCITLGDFVLSSSVLYFNASATVGQISCVQFMLSPNDTSVEGDETFTFQAVPRNPLDAFVNDEDTFSITVFDNDGA